VRGLPSSPPQPLRLRKRVERGWAGGGVREGEPLLLNVYSRDCTAMPVAFVAMTSISITTIILTANISKSGNNDTNKNNGF
jgi:hypothetical protein